MENEIQKSLSQRAKELLKTDGEHSDFELFELVRQYRNESHPDAFQDEKHKKEAEERFKVAQAIVDEFQQHFERDRLNRAPREMALYKPLYNLVQVQQDNDTLKKELSEVKAAFASERQTNASLTIQLQEKEDTSLKTEIQYLKDLYRPSSRGYASLGIAIVLPAVLAMMTQMENVSAVLQRYSPFSKEYLTTALFVCMLLAIITAVRKVWEQGYIKRKSEEVCSSKGAEEFLQFLKRRRNKSSMSLDEVPVVEFSEVEVFDFICGQNSWQKKLSSLLGFRIYRRDTVARLSDIFIHNLLNRKLAHISKAENMQRHFAVSSSRPELYWYNKYQEELAKTQKS